MFNIGLLLLGGIASIYGLLGFFGVEVWIRNRGWVELSFTESIFYFFVGLILLVYARGFKNK